MITTHLIPKPVAFFAALISISCATTPPAPVEQQKAAAVRPEEQLSMVTASGVRLRMFPNLQGEILARMERGDRIAVISRTPDVESIDGDTYHWYYIRETRGGRNGWVFGAYIDRASLKAELLDVLSEKKLGVAMVTQYSFDGLMGPGEDIIPENLGKVFGKGKYRHEGKIENRHNGIMDDLYEMKYRGLTVNFYHARGIRRHIATRIVLERPSPWALWGLTVGSSIELLKRKFGEPNDTADDALIYRTDQMEGHILTFTVRGGKIGSIRWDYRLD